MVYTKWFTGVACRWSHLWMGGFHILFYMLLALAFLLQI